MSLYTPVFPVMPIPKRLLSQSSSDSSPSGSSRQPQVSLSDRLRDQHLALASIPAILSPPSPTPDPDSRAAGNLMQQIRSAVEAARGHPSNGRWAHVCALTKLGCSDDNWRGFGRQFTHRPDEGLEYILCDTEEEYAEWEVRQEERRHQARQRIEEGVERELEEQLARAADPKAQAEAVAKVISWQADVVPASQPTEAVPQATKQKTPSSSPLGFPVVKPGAPAGLSKGKERALAPVITSRFFPPPVPTESLQPKSPVPAPALLEHAAQAASAPMAMDISPEEAAAPPPAPVKEDLRISQVSDSFLPPSFSNVVTSTPPPEKPSAKTKPPVIPTAPGLFFASSPSEPAPFAPSQAVEPGPIAGPSSPSHKRPREQTSPIEDSFEAEVYAPVILPKKPRVTVTPDLAPAVKQTMPALSPPRTSIPPLSECSSASTPPGLGSAHGLPPLTPNRRVLAKSHRSQPRPRPPSRRQSVVAAGEQGGDNGDGHEARTFFSSPASVSSSGSREMVPASPLSPLYTREKAPVGSQYADLGYNSQIDVEGRVERISAILDHEVDFDQWIRQSTAPEDG